MSRNINDLREALFDTINAVKTGSMNIEQARAINDLSQSLVATAKVELDYLRITEEAQSAFINPEQPPALPSGITCIVRHRIAG
jgi:TATA-box binding protein (TBP) (component of TFIID and TFIIIB)